MCAKTIANDLVTGLLSHKAIISPSRSDLSSNCFSKLAFFAKKCLKSYKYIYFSNTFSIIHRSAAIEDTKML